MVCLGEYSRCTWEACVASSSYSGVFYVSDRSKGLQCSTSVVSILLLSDDLYSFGHLLYEIPCVISSLSAYVSSGLVNFLICNPPYYVINPFVNLVLRLGD